MVIAGGSRVAETLDEGYLDSGAGHPASVAYGRAAPAPATDEFARLLAAAKGGDEEAFAVIWRRFQPPLLRYVRVLAGAEADDLTSDTWLQVTRKLLEFEGDEIAFRAWLYTIVRNRHIDWRRRASRRNESSTESEVFDRRPAVEDPVAVVEAKMSTDSALALVATLPADQAEAVMLRAVAGLPVAVAAEIMGRPPGTVRVLCHRGLRRLEQTLRAASQTSPHSTGGMVV